jgi:hypothetical protein
MKLSKRGSVGVTLVHASEQPKVKRTYYVYHKPIQLKSYDSLVPQVH